VATLYVCTHARQVIIVIFIFIIVIIIINNNIIVTMFWKKKKKKKYDKSLFVDVFFVRAPTNSTETEKENKRTFEQTDGNEIFKSNDYNSA